MYFNVFNFKIKLKTNLNSPINKTFLPFNHNKILPAQLPTDNLFGKWTLNLVRLQQSDQGTYSCLIASGGSTIRMHFVVRVLTNGSKDKQQNSTSGQKTNFDVDNSFNNDRHSNSQYSSNHQKMERSKESTSSSSSLPNPTTLSSGLQLNNTTGRLGHELRLLCRSTWPNPQPHFKVSFNKKPQLFTELSY